MYEVHCYSLVGHVITRDEFRSFDAAKHFAVKQSCDCAILANGGIIAMFSDGHELV